ncbi:hypothetical protein BOTBODRAFT_250008 [Botryobasidium botryosum FD-172 SS1]|uniref:Uncharacterized protein n=1 Tax=Botryobasidium botryosum (strain FD-172 SS1) TaxID=930990 RepID=A0A067MX62_BOTB1|nr:hypothetical protein BOTBODRAFT_250008 [Botryobasidium botryosum FD-172 SS1]
MRNTTSGLNTRRGRGRGERSGELEAGRHGLGRWRASPRVAYSSRVGPCEAAAPGPLDRYPAHGGRADPEQRQLR